MDKTWAINSVLSYLKHSITNRITELFSRTSNVPRHEILKKLIVLTKR